MDGQMTHTGGAQMRRELSDFVTRKITDTSCGWPRRLASLKPPRSQATAQRSVLRVLIVGDLTLELPIEMQATRAQAVELLRDPAGKKKACWKMSKARVGGFVGHCARVAASLGAKISVCTSIPCPWPSQFDAFFEELNLEDRYVTSLPGACPVTAVLRCTDGVVHAPRRTAINAAGLDLPHGVAIDYDVILVDLSQFGQRQHTLSVLHNSLGATDHRFVAGIWVEHGWTTSDLSATRDRRVWAFADYTEAKELARRVAPLEGRPDGKEDCDNVARRLCNECGISKLVMHLGSSGAVLLNGGRQAYHVDACPVAPVRPAGHQQVLLTVTTLSSASGAEDKTSLCRGVAAATGYAAGLEPPTSLEELDAA